VERIPTSPEEAQGGAIAGPFRYEAEIHVDSESTHAKVVRLVGTDRDVFELGCATGDTSRVLRDRGCRVVGDAARVGTP